MKTFVSFLGIFLLAGASVEAATRDGKIDVPTMSRDTIRVTDYSDGQPTGHHYQITRNGDADYALHYRMNLAQLYPAFEDNSLTLDELRIMLERMGKDPDFRVESIVIRGCTSPGGPSEFNRELAAQRAAQFKEMMTEKYPCCRNCPVELRSEASEWKDCCEAVCHSQIPDKDVLRSSDSDQKKEAALKQMPDAWTYMCAEILPDMRRVDLMIDFDEKENCSCPTDNNREAFIVDYNMSRGETRKGAALENRAEDNAKALDKIDRSVNEYVEDTTTAIEDSEKRVDAEREKAIERDEEFTSREQTRLSKKEARYARRLQRKAMKAEKKAHRNLKKAR